MSVKTARERIDVLVRRRQHLAELASVRSRTDISYVRSELAALTWAIRVLENALAGGEIERLEAMAPSLLEQS